MRANEAPLLFMVWGTETRQVFGTVPCCGGMLHRRRGGRHHRWHHSSSPLAAAGNTCNGWHTGGCLLHSTRKRVGGWVGGALGAWASERCWCCGGGAGSMRAGSTVAVVAVVVVCMCACLCGGGGGGGGVRACVCVRCVYTCGCVCVRARVSPEFFYSQHMDTNMSVSWAW